MKYKKYSQLAGLIVIFISIVLQSGGSYEASQIVKSHVEEGYVDTSSWDFNQKQASPLNGEWEFYWMNLLGPEDFKANNYQQNYISIPNELSKKNLEDMGLSEDGYATLRLRIKVSDIRKMYGLKFNYFASSNKIWVNGKQIASAGQVGVNRQSYKAQYMPLEVLFESDTKEIEVIVQIANFHHRRIRLSEVLFGTSLQIMNTTYQNLIKESTIFGGLLLISIYCVILYFIQRRDTALIYLAFIASVTAIRGSIIGERLLIRLFPYMPGEMMMKLGYLPVFILLPLFILYVKEIFSSPKLDKIVRVSKGFIFLVTLLMLTTSVKVYDWIFEYGSGLIILMAVYVIYIVSINGLLKNTRGSYTMAIGGGAVLLTAVSDMLRELGFTNATELLSVGIVIFIIVQAVFLAWRFNDSFERTEKLVKENENMYEEIQALNRDLEDKISIRTKELEMVNSQLEKISQTDGLTGLKNRRYFDERFQQEWDKSLEQQSPLSIIMIDIDFFKNFNDYYGHPEGDTCLKKIGSAVMESMNHENDVAARYGGEEFVVLLPNTDMHAAYKMAEHIRNTVNTLKIEHKHSATNEYVTISLGVNTQVASQDSLKETFIKEADKALYLAKEKGRDTIEVQTIRSIRI